MMVANAAATSAPAGAVVEVTVDRRVFVGDAMHKEQ
jgi:hypothetical protein